MKKLVFINPQYRPNVKERILPVGLASVMTAVGKYGYSFDLIDMDINNYSLNDLEDIFSKKDYDIFAFGLMSSALKLGSDIAKVIKKHKPNSIIIAGNSIASTITDITLNNTEIDIAVLGEGDLTMPELLEVIFNNKSLHSVKGIAFKENNKIVYTPKRELIKDLDEIGFPDWDYFELDKYFESPEIQGVYSNDLSNVKAIPLATGRGCPFHCTFCYIEVRDDKNRYRRYSDEAIFSEMNRLHNKYGVNYFQFWDDLTVPNVREANKFADMLLSLNFKIRWSASVRGDLFKDKDMNTLKKLKESGCDFLFFSLESGNLNILKSMKKKLNIEQFINQVNLVRKAEITVYTSVIFGYPEETSETIEETLNICEKAKIFPSVGFLLPLPKTEVYETAKLEGKIKDEYSFLMSLGDRQDLHANLTKMSNENFLIEVEKKLEFLAKKLSVKRKSLLKTEGFVDASEG